VRTPQQVAESLFRISRPTPDDAPAPPRPENKRVWASLLKGKDAVIQEVAEEMERRDPSASKTRVALTDGERALQIRVDRKLKVTLILDLMHALEKCGRPLMSSMPRAAWRPISGSSTALCESCQAVWARWLRDSVKASPNAHFREPNAKRWRELPNTFIGTAPACAITNTSPTAGRIASGPVEGACKNLIKDRMERSGMRWTKQMAEAIVQLRAVYLSGDFDDYWQFHIEQDQKRLYPDVWSVVPK